MPKEKTTEVTQDSRPLRMVKADYKAMYEAAKKTGMLKRPTYRIHTWKEDSAVLIGRVNAISEFKGGKYDQAANAYLIDTDDGNVSCVLGSYTDTQIKDLVKPGSLVAIIFRGKKDLGDERKVNIFDVDVIEEPKE